MRNRSKIKITPLILVACAVIISSTIYATQIIQNAEESSQKEETRTPPTSQTIQLVNNAQELAQQEEIPTNRFPKIKTCSKTDLPPKEMIQCLIEQKTILKSMQQDMDNEYTLLPVYSDNERNTWSGEYSTTSSPYQYNQQNAPIQTAHFVQKSIPIKITAEMLQQIIDSIPQKSELPSGTSILIGFFNRNEKFLLQGQNIVNYEGQDYDALVETQDIYLDGLLTDFLETACVIKVRQDWRSSINPSKSVISVSMKYFSLRKFKDWCS